METWRGLFVLFRVVLVLVFAFGTPEWHQTPTNEIQWYTWVTVDQHAKTVIVCMYCTADMFVTNSGSSFMVWTITP